MREALEHQTATAEVLGIISRSPTDVQPVLDAIVESAARVCGIDDVLLRLREGNATVPQAHFGSIAIGRAEISIDEPQYRWMNEHGALHIPDVRAQNEFPGIGSAGNFRSYLGAPLLQQGDLIGVLNARRTEVRPFTPAQIKLLETFADQAVIAIENVRLFQELKESLEQQTATSEILGVIASSPTDIQPVLDVVAENVVRVCGAEDALIWRLDGNSVRLAAINGLLPASEIGAERSLGPGTILGRAVRDRETVHIHDLAAAEAEFPNALGLKTGVRTVLAMPLLREGNPIGVIHIRRMKVQPFSEKQIALLKTFADQAVIAIENVRLFKELEDRNRQITEALEQQTATSEILGVIASSPTDIQPVLNVVAENAAQLCEATDAVIRLIEGDGHRLVASFGTAPAPEFGHLGRRTPTSRAILNRHSVHVLDLAEAAKSEYPDSEVVISRSGTRTFLSVPMLREGNPIGVINIRRTEVRPFSERQIKLLETFAAQAVIAIENVRLFRELQERNRQLTEALEQQTATSEILRVIASSPTDIQPVLDTVAENAARLCQASDAQIFRVRADSIIPAASYGSMPVREYSLPISRGYPTGRAIVDGQTIDILDIVAEVETEFPEAKNLQQLSGARTILVTPLLREGVPIGTINIRRTEVRPFTEKQIKLLETFADQAVIAIENVRLFQELKESLEQQTATSEILGVIASSPTDIQPVLDTVVKNAARLCEATNAQIRLVEGEGTRLVASFGSVPVPEFSHVSSRVPSGRVILTRETLHIHDLQEVKQEFPESEAARRGVRTFLLTPMLREGTPIGLITFSRMEVRPFSDKHIKLLETFANQAVIAIENVRLFKELQERNAELREALEHQTATAEVLGIISRSPTNVQPVLTPSSRARPGFVGSMM